MTPLTTLKLVHSIVWAFFVACIVAIPSATFAGELRTAAVFAAIVAVEVLVLFFNRMQCPITGLAARHTDDRRANFDIYLPEWLARYNKHIFGTLYALSVAYLLIRWTGVGAT